MELTTWLSIFIPLLFGVVITLIGCKIKGNSDLKKMELEQHHADEQSLIDAYSDICCAANSFFSSHSFKDSTGKLCDTVGKFKAIAPEMFRVVLLNLERAVRNASYTSIQKYLAELDEQWISYRFGNKKQSKRNRGNKK